MRLNVKPALSAALLATILPPGGLACGGEDILRASTALDGGEGSRPSARAAVSTDGRWIAFYSDAHELVPGDTPTYDPVLCPDCTGARDIFVKDTETGAIVRVSISSAGAAGNGASDRPSISGDGRFVAFASSATNLVTGDLNLERDVFVHDRDPDGNGVLDEGNGITTRVSVAPGGGEALGESSRPAISEDGQWIAFTSNAANLPGANGSDLVYVRSRTGGDPVLVARSTSGAVAGANTDRAAISADGRLVAFYSDAINLVSGDTNGQRDVFVHDRDPDGNGAFDEGNGTTVRASVSNTGLQGNGESSRPRLSGNGRFVAFRSAATNLVTGDSNAAEDVFVRDLVAQRTVRVSVAGDGAQTQGAGPDSDRAALSADGRFVAFHGTADDLVLGDFNGADDIFVRDRALGTTVRVSVGSFGVPANDSSNRPDISDDGRFVAFYSDANNLVTGDFNQVRDVFVHDRDPDGNGTFDEGNGITERVSVADDGSEDSVPSTRPALSGNGQHVAFVSAAAIAPGSNGVAQILVRDRSAGTTVIVSMSSDGNTGDLPSDRPSMSASGRFVAFASDASNLVDGDDGLFEDVFVHDRDPDGNGIFDEENGVTECLTLGAAGDSERPVLSADGRWVAFHSEAENLGDGDGNGHTDVFVHDRATGATVLLSRAEDGTPGNFGSEWPAISADGRLVAFRSKADNLVPGDDPSYDADSCPSCTGVKDIFVHDRDPDGNGVFDEGNGTMARVSVASDGAPADREADLPRLAALGGFVVFDSRAGNLVAGDANNASDLFVHELATGSTERASVAWDGSEATTPLEIVPDSDRATLSDDGRFVAFRSAGVNLVEFDTNRVLDVFLHDRDADGNGVLDEIGGRTTVRLSVSAGGGEADGDSDVARISGDGSLVAFSSDATNLVPDDTNGVTDVYARRLAAGPPGNPADVNGDGSVDIQDLLLVLAGWGACPPPPADCADTDGDGIVGVSDLLMVLGNWGA